jgi:hypothetical protein
MGWWCHPLSPPPVPIRAASPYHGLVDADLKGVRWGTWTRTTTAGVKGQPPAIFLIPIESRPPVPIRASPLTGGRSQPCAAALCTREELCARRGFEPPQPSRTTATSTLRVYLFRHGHPGAAPGADPGHPPYEGGAAAVRDGVSCPARTRTSIA